MSKDGINSVGLNLVLLEVGSFRQEGSQITLPFARPAHVAVRLSPMRKVHLEGEKKKIFGCVECKAFLFYFEFEFSSLKERVWDPVVYKVLGRAGPSEPSLPECPWRRNSCQGPELCFPALVMSSKTSAKSSEGRVLGSLSEGSVSLVPG